MALDHDLCWRAVQSRDRRFDGRFFTAVTSTGIYCRPGCPARMPARRNVRFYASAAAAESAGFRPCRRCRPDTAPGSAAWLGAPAVVARAVRLIEAGALSADTLAADGGERGVEALAARLGIGGRRLRQLFAEHVGASPLEVARTHRAHVARRLLEDTSLPLEQVAHAAGYASARRLHAAIAATFHAAPGALRGARTHPRRAAAPAAGARPRMIALRLTARAPFDPAPVLAFLATRAVPGLEHVDGGTYRRAFRLGDDAGVLEARPDARGVTLALPPASARALVPAAARIARIFDLGADTVAIAAHLRRDPALASAVPEHGLRVPGAWDAFEQAVRGLLGQQVTVAGARTLTARLVARCGAPLGDAAVAGVTHTFPDAATLARAELSGLGLTGARLAAIRALARAVADGSLELGAHDSLDAAVAALTALPGIGDWTAQYIALRALGEPDAFPAGDLGVRKALAAPDGALPAVKAAIARAEPWRPWRGYAVIALWTAAAAHAASTRTSPIPRPRAAARTRSLR